VTIERIAGTVTIINLMLLLTLFAVGWSSAQSGATVLRGRVLELVDERGRMRARLNVEKSGEVVFRLMDQRGTIRVKLGASEKGSAFLLANDATEVGVHIVAQTEGSRLRLANKDGSERVITPQQ
jgi:hypothetical protein